MPQRRSGRCSNAYPGIVMSCVLMSRASTTAYFSRGPFRLAHRTLQNHATRLHRKSSRFPTATGGRGTGGGGRQFVRSACGRVREPGVASAARTAWSR